MALLQYDISVVGAASVDKALAGIERRIQEHNRRVAQAVGVTPAQARAIGGGGGAARFRTSDERASGMFAVRKAAAEEKALARDKVRALREEARIKNQINNLNVREYNKELRARERVAMVEQRAFEKTARARSEFVRNTIGHGVERVTGTVKAVGMAGATMLGVGGAGLAASAVAGATRLDEQTRRLVISAREGGTTSKYDPEQLRKQFEQTGIETGISPESVAGGVQQFVTKTGDIDTAVKNQKVFATVAQATGASMEDIASAAADLSEKLDIKSAKDMAQALSTLAFQGKKGAFELKDMAQYLPQISAAASTFGIKGVAGITQLGGMMQVARQATGDGAEAATAIEAMFRQMVAKSADIQSGKSFSGRKVGVFEGNDPTKPLRDFNEILADMITASRGNLQQLGETFDVRGVRAVNPLIAEYRKASEGAGGGEKGVAAGRAAVLAKLHDASFVKGDFGEMQKDASEAMKSFSVQMEVINTRLKEAISSQLLPELMKLGPEIGKLVPYVGQATKMFVDLVKFLMDHPFASLGMVIAGQLAADFAKAQLGSLMRGLLEKAMSSKAIQSITAGTSGTGAASGGTGGFLGRPSAAGALSAVGAGAALGITVATGLFTVGVANFEKSEADMKSSGETLNRIREMNSPEQADEARKLIAEQQKHVNDLRQSNDGVTGGAVNWLANAVGFSNSDVELKTQETFLKEMEAKLQKLDAFADATKRIEASGLSQEEAAKQINEAAKRLGLQMPNRSNTPSPVKS